MEETKPKTRRRHERGLKEQVLAECDEPGASVAEVSLRHGLNANLVHKWRRLACPTPATPVIRASAEFVPVTVPTPAESTPDIRLEVRRGATSITVTWPLAAASDCAIWMRELLR